VGPSAVLDFGTFLAAGARSVRLSVFLRISIADQGRLNGPNATVHKLEAPKSVLGIVAGMGDAEITVRL
jgi:hypothetical protein